MQYMGGKKRIAKEIAKVIQPHIKTFYYEPFCGMCSVGLGLEAPTKIFSDVHSELIALLRHVRDGGKLPDKITKSEYDTIRDSADCEGWLKGFVGFGCSYAGRYFDGGYARNSRGDNYAASAARSMSAMRSKMTGCYFYQSNYSDLVILPDSVVYCDPPYSGTKRYSVGKFDHSKFWRWCQWQSEECGNIVFVSELQAPDNFTCVWEKEVRRELRGKGGRKQRVEKLFVHESQGWRFD